MEVWRVLFERLVLGAPGVLLMVTGCTLAMGSLWLAVAPPKPEWSWLVALFSLPCVLASGLIPHVSSWALAAAFLSLAVMAPATLLVSTDTALNRKRASIILCAVALMLVTGRFIPESFEESPLSWVLAVVEFPLLIGGIPIAVLLLAAPLLLGRRTRLVVLSACSGGLSFGMWVARAYLYRP